MTAADSLELAQARRRILASLRRGMAIAMLPDGLRDPVTVHATLPVVERLIQSSTEDLQ